MILLEEFKNCIHPSLKIILPKIKLQLCKKHQKWMANSFSLTYIFFRRVPKVPLLKETFTMRKILLILITLHQTSTPPSKDFTYSSLTSRDYVPLTGDLTPVHQGLMPVYQDSMPVHQDLMPLYQDSTPVLQDLKPACQDFMSVCQDSTPVYLDSTPVYQDLMPVCQDFVPASQDLPIVKDVCATSDSVSEVYKPFISGGLVSLLHDKVNSRNIKILRDTGAS